MSNYQSPRPVRSRRTVLYVPADNDRAMEKSLTLPADAVIYDLEDAIIPEKKAEARENLRNFFKENFPNGTDKSGREVLIRMNLLSTEWGAEDLLAIRAIMPSAIVLPKVSEPDDIIEVNDALSEMDAPQDLRIWAMIETARGILNVAKIAQHARTPGNRLDCFVAGTNDLIKETNVSPVEGRPYLSNWLSQIVLAARAYGLDIIDGVYNDFRDAEGFESACLDGRAMGFDGKSVIHPAQLDAANRVFGISEDDLLEANAVVQAFALPENHDVGVIQLDGRMVERLHLEMAEKLILKAATATK